MRSCRSPRARRAADELRFAAADLRAEQQAYVINSSGERSAFDAAVSRFESCLGAVASSTDGPVEESLVRKITTGYETFLHTDQ